MIMFKKIDFKNGMVVELANKEKRLYWDGNLIAQSDCIPIRYYDNDLKNMNDASEKNKDINKVFLTHDIGYFNDFFRYYNLTKIWSRY